MRARSADQPHDKYYNRSGFSPYQQVFGYNPRLRALASDDLLDSALVHQGAGGPIKRAWESTDAASQAWMRNKDSEMVSSAVRKRTRVADSKKLSIGDWAMSGNRPNGNLLRGHLVKASREQVRPATADLVLNSYRSSCRR